MTAQSCRCVQIVTGFGFTFDAGWAKTPADAFVVFLRTTSSEITRKLYDIGQSVFGTKHACPRICIDSVGAFGFELDSRSGC